MAQRNRTTLKAYMESGKKPTQEQFADFIDSVFNFIDDDMPVGSSSVNFAAFVDGEQVLSNSSISAEPNTPITLEAYPVATEPYAQVRWTIFQEPADYSLILYGQNVTAIIPVEGVFNVSCSILKVDNSSVAMKVVSGFITVSMEPSAENQIQSFRVAGTSCTINHSTGDILGTVPFGTILNPVTPQITISAGASILPSQGTPVDLTGVRSYFVTAENGDEKEYEVDITVEQPVPTTRIRFGYRTSLQGSLSKDDPDFDGIVLGTINSSQNDNIDDTTPELVNINFKDFGIDQFTQSWHWLLVPATVAEYNWCDWVGNLGTPKSIATKIISGDPVDVIVDGENYNLYRLLFDVSGNWTFSVNTIN